jgi:hypothetical protein
VSENEHEQKKPSSLFRKNALEYISTPHARDDLVQITPPRAWIMLATFWIILGAIVLWSIFGSIAIHVEGPGILLGKNEMATETQGLEAIVFISADVGKRVRKGMRSKVTPSTVTAFEYGSIEGIVTDVGNFPSTPESMQSILNNKSLVDTFLMNGPVIMVRVQLIADAATYSGLKWTSSSGPTYIITTGTLVQAEVMTSSQSPISFFIPFLKKTVGFNHGY